MKQITGVIGWVGTALIFAALGIRIFKPEWAQYQTWATWAGLVCILIYFAGQWRDVVTFYGRRQARYGTISVVSVLVGAGILVAVNYLATRQSTRWDFTENQAYSLSDQSVKVLQDLDAPVKFTVFDQDINFGRFRDRLDTYEYHSDNLSVEYVDADRSPARAEAAEIRAYGTILIEYKDRKQRVTSTEEQDITNALIKLVSGGEKKVYFTAGHSERDTAGSDRAGFSTINSALARDNFAVDKVVLIQQKDVPDDAAIVVVAGPRNDFLAPEIDALRRYLARGGKVLFMIDPVTDDSPDVPNLRALLKEWAIEFGNDVVVDASGMGQLFGGDASVPVAGPGYPSHPITDGFNVITAFPLARSVKTVEGGAEGRTASPVVQTSPQSWAEVDLKALAAGGRVEPNFEGGDTQGPITLAAAVSAPAAAPPAPAPAAGNSTPETPADAPKPETRIIAMGDSDFAANYAIGIVGNQDLFLNAINWLAQQENLIAIRPREAQDRRITLTADTQRGIMLLSLLLIPGMVFAGGIYVWWRRR